MTQLSLNIYRDVIGLRPLVRWDKGAYFLVGDDNNGFWFCLNVDEKREPGACYTHYTFSVSPENFERLSKKIVDSGAIIFKENTSSGDSLYFLDPDDHKLEIHTGDWCTRIETKKQTRGAWRNVEFFIQ